jgi:hypothetical protein
MSHFSTLLQPGMELLKLRNWVTKVLDDVVRKDPIKHGAKFRARFCDVLPRN